MKNPFTNIFRSQPKTIPEKVVKALLEQFPDAINIDWEFKNKIYEAIFYVADAEHIAKISTKTGLVEFKKNLWPSELPESIATEGNKLGEIMNAIAIFKGLDKFYEIIVRNKEFDRTVLLFDDQAALLNSQKI